MESVSKIRRWVLVEGRSIRSVARATGLSRNTIKKYLKDESPPSYQRQAPPVRHKLCNGFDLRLRELFEQDLKRPRRERRTALRLYERLVVEGYTGSYSPVQRFVRDLKRTGAVLGDAFVRALSFYGGVPRRVIIDNPKTMVTYVSRSKDRIFHPRFLTLMNHYVMEPSSIGLEPMAPSMNDPARPLRVGRRDRSRTRFSFCGAGCLCPSPLLMISMR